MIDWLRLLWWCLKGLVTGYGPSFRCLINTCECEAFRKGFRREEDDD